MGVAAEPNPRPAAPPPRALARLLPPGPPSTAAELVAGFELDALAASRPAERPYVLLNMVSTVDGQAALGGRSVSLSGPADRELFHELRTAVDGVLAGAATVRAERYGRIVPDASRRRRRIERGQFEEPLACIVSASLAFPEQLPLLAEPAARVAILTPSTDSLPASGAEVHYIRAERHGLLDLPRAFAELRERFGVRTLLCEGGPHLNGQLLEAGLVDELFLSLAPTLAGGAPATTGAMTMSKETATDGAMTTSEQALRILAGPTVGPPVELELLSVLEHDSHLFLRYRVS